MFDQFSVQMNGHRSAETGRAATLESSVCVFHHNSFPKAYLQPPLPAQAGPCSKQASRGNAPRALSCDPAPPYANVVLNGRRHKPVHALSNFPGCFTRINGIELEI
jgi:hypothetical protein